MSVNQRLKQIIASEESQNFFAQKINTSPMTVSSMVNRNGGVSTEILLRIANAYPKLNLHWLLTGTGEMWLSDETEKPNLAAETVAVYNSQGKREVRFISDIAVSAGKPSEYMGTSDYTVLNIEGAYPDSIAMTVTGNSMYPTISDGDIVVARPWHLDKIHEDNVYIFEIEGDGFTLKRARVQGQYLQLLFGDGRTVPHPLKRVKKVWLVYKRLTNF